MLVFMGPQMCGTLGRMSGHGTCHEGMGRVPWQCSGQHHEAGGAVMDVSCTTSSASAPHETQLMETASVPSALWGC